MKSNRALIKMKYKRNYFLYKLIYHHFKLLTIANALNLSILMFKIDH